MSTPVLNPNSSNMNPALTAYQAELSKILRKHDPNAVRLYDFINHVKVFLYNSHESRWEINPYIIGSLFFYKRQQIINNQVYQNYALAVVSGEQILMQPISPDMSHQVDKLCLFYEVMRNGESQVFSLHFSNENECRRLDTFIKQVTRNLKEQQLRNSELQVKQTHGQRQQTPVNILPSYESSRQTPNHFSAQQSTPIINSNNSTLSLKRLLNISNPNGVAKESSLSPQPNSVALLPPSAFASLSGHSHSSASDECDINNPLMSREHFRNVLLHLVQTNDQFLDIIHQACLSYQSP